MSFDFDDEDQNVPYAYYTPATNRASLQENKQQVLLELLGASSTSERFGLDLVAVLDVSYSMTRENRLDKMKTAVQFVIKKLSPMDRLSIVTFFGNAKMMCPLRSVTQASQSHLKDLVDGLRTRSATNVQAGLETGLNVLNDRRIAGGRVASIFVLSDGEQNEGDAMIVDVSDVAVYTFGFGAATNHKDTVQNVCLVPHTATNTAPLQMNRQQVMLELIDASSTSERFGLDLVAVLDVNESMYFPGKHRLGKMKTAMQFVIKKLSPMDRLSIVTFSDVAKRLCPLRSVTQVSQAHLMDLVDGLTGSGRTNIEDVLRTGHKVLTDRRIAGGRIASIFLLSDGDQKQGDAMIVDVRDVAVYTFGFGADYDPKMLDEIARKSKGGTFSFVGDEENMSEPFSQILGGLLSVVLQDLKLTVSPHPGDSAIENVNAVLYQQTRNANTGSVTISFGDLFTTEVRRIIVDVLLPAIHRKKKVTAIIAYCTYSIQGKPFVSRELTVTISRTGSVVPNIMKPEAMRTELARRRHANYLEEARTMADNKDLKSAKNKLVEAKNDLELEQTNTMIQILRTHPDKLLELTRFPGLRAYLRSLKTSHDRQRIAATGDVKGDRLFDTHIMGIVRGEAEEFVKNPTMEVRPIGHDFIEAKKGRDQQGMERPPMMEARTWWWGDWKSHHESSRWAWAMVILCTVFAVYLIYKPKMPHLVVSDAQLGALQYAQQDGTIQYLQLPITILAENKNSKADATFSRVDLALQFHGADLALLRTPASFVVAAESSLPLQYNVVSTGRTLNPAGMWSMDESLSAGVVPFDLRGKARTRWKVGIFLKVHFWTRISCRLHFFFPGNSTVMPTDLHSCRSRSP